MVIHVLPEHIAAGIRSSCCSCPVALAINAVLAPGWYAQVGANTFDLHRTMTAMRLTCLELPVAARDFIRRFDSGGGESFSFELDLPAEVLP